MKRAKIIGISTALAVGLASLAYAFGPPIFSGPFVLVCVSKEEVGSPVFQLDPDNRVMRGFSNEDWEGPLMIKPHSYLFKYGGDEIVINRYSGELISVKGGLIYKCEMTDRKF